MGIIEAFTTFAEHLEFKDSIINSPILMMNSRTFLKIYGVVSNGQIDDTFGMCFFLKDQIPISVQ